jgi:DNA-binding MarR family transcriptional regulator
LTVTDQRNSTDLAWQLRRALSAHRAAISGALARAGCDDLPPRALWAIDTLRSGDRSAAELARVLEVSKQAMSPLVEVLVNLGYVERTADDLDRRRIALRLTSRGRTAATAIARACERVESHVATRVGKRNLELARETIAAIGAPVPSTRS